jgi:hypothetical protein
VYKFYKYLKLTNGDDIIATTDTDCKDFKKEKSIFVYDPVLINTIRISQGSYLVETFTMQPWIKLAKEDIIEIPTESIIVAVDIEDKVQEQYDSFLHDSMSSTSEAEEFTEDQLEELMEGIEDAEYDDDNHRDGNETKKQGPTYH